MFSVAIAFLAAPLRLYIDPKGDDRRDGHLRSSSIRTFDHLREVLMAERTKDASRPIIVEVNGSFHFQKPVEFGPELSNVELYGTTSAVLSGGIVLPKPVKDTFNGHACLSVTVPKGLTPKQLFMNQLRLHRPTLPETGFYQFTGYLDGAEKSEWNKGQDAMRFKPGDIKNWRNLGQVEIVAHHLWVTSILPIKSVDEGSSTVQFGKTSVFKLSDDYTGGAAPYVVENVTEAFGKPNDWYFDPPTQKIYWMSTFPNTPGRTYELTAPVAPTLMKITGAKNFHIHQLEFRHTEWSYPANMSGDVQAAISVPGALQLSQCSGGRIQRCGFTNIGTYGIEVLAGCENNEITNCTVEDMGGGGIKIGHDSSATTVRSCTLDAGGRIFAPAIGVWIGNSGNNIVEHNDIMNFYYTGISVGWSWGYGQSKAIHNKIEYNHIWDIGQNQLSDMGGIYTLGVSPGTTIRFNRIDNVSARGYGGWGIYTDEGSSGILIENNIVTNTKTGGFHQHYGKENIVRNNIFAYAQRDGQIIRSRQEEHTSFTFEHNVVLWKGTELLGGAWSNGHYIFGHNLLCREDGKVNLPPGDQESLVVPTLKLGLDMMPPKDLAEKVGFVPFDVKNIGIRKWIPTK